MQRFWALAFGATLFLTVAAPAAAATPAAKTTAAPVATPDPTVTATAKTFYHALASGTIDRAKLSADANAKLTDQTVADVAGKLAPLGDPVSFEFVKSQRQGGSMLYAYALTFPSGDKLEYVVGLDAQGKVSAVALRPIP
jgi:D-alanyl-D-alanine carboxypeptidase